ncbi:ankyrin repeat domain-containing protein 13C-like [Pyrus ussuriensis x Pyrus communis]|uniref:Ankyrin repeat domain-containing protein 13C-like n=1 Tax=Pyrus ussuriensis x Pyrus communis TaxID=2448454 RepID=A0A5N5GID7_9ROSA|nr:ankyrin repeat domain-containing protein 13C-like [Pyrus ussuriensis x Pyrus communis]
MEYTPSPRVFSLSNILKPIIMYRCRFCSNPLCSLRVRAPTLMSWRCREGVGESDDGFLVAKNPSFGIPDGMRHSSFVREDREFMALGTKSVDLSSISEPPKIER